MNTNFEIQQTGSDFNVIAAFETANSKWNAAHPVKLVHSPFYPDGSLVPYQPHVEYSPAHPEAPFKFQDEVFACSNYADANDTERATISAHLQHILIAFDIISERGLVAFYDETKLPQDVLYVIRQVWNKFEGSKRAIENRKKFGNIIAAATNQYQPGAILYDCWGNEQTNIDYYVIVKRSGDMLTLLPMVKTSVAKGANSMETVDTPTSIKYDATPVRKKILKRDFKEIGFTFRDYACGGWCSLWNGTAKVATHYA